MNNVQKFVVLTVGAVCLSGCASIFGGKRASLAQADGMDMAEIYHEYAAYQLEMGRKQLRASAYASAIESLRKASRDAQSAPAAYNAMGVAYAKMNRPEVAARFFRLALILDPEDEAFAANFRRLKAENPGQSQVSERRLAAVEPPAANKQAENQRDEKATTASLAPARETRSQLVKPAFGANVSATTGSGRIHRVSSHEVYIGEPRDESPGKRRTIAISSEYPIRVKLSPSRHAK